ncbi:BlaI/MecI/CopY family transcriptional regulator [Parafrankia elaeagni]|uniref:BlaI/MecI/CopY family transcriptional regulator n=1 Tax=Parafrankia elaeagni TaxID=222534 RepID=UPI00036E0C95|nr:BlaI/MecI/CopY family transcriptional regulator [Parafrankia elaeagni]
MHEDSEPPVTQQAHRRRPPGQLEEDVLGVLHRSGELSPGEVRDLLPDVARLSYSAVVTTLTRLHTKGVVTRRRHGRGYLYSSPGDPTTLVAWRMNRLLAGQSDHRRALTHFIAALSPTDEALVRDLLASAPEASDGGVVPGGVGEGTGTAPDLEQHR